MKQVGTFTPIIIQLLSLSTTADTPIYLGETNIIHMVDNHPDDYTKYFSMLEDILADPDWVIPDPDSDGIQFIKQVDARIIVAVRASGSGRFFVRTLFSMTREKVSKYAARGLFDRYRVPK